jgi:hypothetical protein
MEYIVPYTASFRRDEYMHPSNDLYDTYRNEFTYYNRHCHIFGDIPSTRDASDLIVTTENNLDPSELMLRHGAVAMPNLLSHETATELRSYLSAKHKIRDALDYNEVFWNGEDGTRLSLGLGVSDHPYIIRRALQEVGTNDILRKTLSSILGNDPAIVEISTLTAIHGAHPQGIHSDSDYFGSSVLYARTFLHSYSMFIALQNTSEALGATTICPGSHVCADVDLSEACLLMNDDDEEEDDDEENPRITNSFSVSSNGKTGRKHGLLKMGDGFLFNQNVWHRGPANTEPSQQDRVMFILTFVTQRRPKTGDRRRQALGTYYYQRWNMWGSTFDDLAHAGTAFLQPFAALRALGLIQFPRPNKVGITWIEQVAHQIANAEDFYTSDELEEFRTKILDKYRVPKSWTASSATEWNTFLPETFQIWVRAMGILYAGWMGFLILGSLLFAGVSGTKRFLQRTIRLHGIMLGMAFLVWYGIVERTDLARSVRSGDVFVRPFPDPQHPFRNPEEFASVGPTTLPERNDVLIGTRFDAEFLASFDRFLDFHPGNRVWNQKMEQYAKTAVSDSTWFYDHAARHIVTEITGIMEPYGTTRRFLWQDPNTGVWRILTFASAVQETGRAIQGIVDPRIGVLAKSLKQILADARFGIFRDTVMARRFTPLFVEKWMNFIYNHDTNGEAMENDIPHRRKYGLLPTKKLTVVQSRSRQLFVQTPIAASRTQTTNVARSWSPISERNSLLIQESRKADVNEEDADEDSRFKPGDWVWVSSENDPVWYEARLIEQVDHNDDYDDDDEEEDSKWEVEYFGGYRVDSVDESSLRKYIAWKEGDEVLVDFREMGRDFAPGIIKSIHPDGTCRVRMHHGKTIERIRREFLLPLE